MGPVKCLWWGFFAKLITVQNTLLESLCLFLFLWAGLLFSTAWKVYKYSLLNVLSTFNWIRENTNQKKLHIWTIFTLCRLPACTCLYLIERCILVPVKDRIEIFPKWLFVANYYYKELCDRWFTGSWKHLCELGFFNQHSNFWGLKSDSFYSFLSNIWIISFFL